MNLQPLRKRLPDSDPGIAGWCVDCNAIVREGAGYADLDGRPFKAYYCRQCATRLLDHASLTYLRRLARDSAVRQPYEDRTVRSARHAATVCGGGLWTTEALDLCAYCLDNQSA